MPAHPIRQPHTDTTDPTIDLQPRRDTAFISQPWSGTSLVLCIVRPAICRRLLGGIHRVCRAELRLPLPASVSHLVIKASTSTSICAQTTLFAYNPPPSATQSPRPLNMAQQQADNVMRRYARPLCPPAVSRHNPLRPNCTRASHTVRDSCCGQFRCSKSWASNYSRNSIHSWTLRRRLMWALSIGSL